MPPFQLVSVAQIEAEIEAAMAPARDGVTNLILETKDLQILVETKQTFHRLARLTLVGPGIVGQFPILPELLGFDCLWLHLNGVWSCAP